ncbi:MAG: hypothetical protein O3C01_07965 [Bacteroidetes bacterium]|nr:hypothetical protein [Bacteroidota bacterium]
MKYLVLIVFTFFMTFVSAGRLDDDKRNPKIDKLQEITCDKYKTYFEQDWCDFIMKDKDGLKKPKNKIINYFK